MLATRLTPKVLLYALIPQLALIVLAHLAAQFDWWPHYRGLAPNFRNAVSIIAFAIALLLNLEIAREYRKTPLLHLAWLAMAANAGLSVVRMILEGPWLGLVWSEYDKSLSGLYRHLAIVPANLALLLGVAAMCLAYHRVGLGFEIERRDYLLMGTIAAVLIALLTFREGLTEAHSFYPAGRYLQQTGLVLLAIISAVSVLLHRMAIRMGGGQLSKVLMLITLYALSRSTIVLVGAITPTLHPEARFFIRGFIELAWLTTFWLPALAAAYRMQMTADAVREINNLENRRVTDQVAPVSV
ncbi:MAG: hypothetical protein JST85_17250 [Acidobacteria bacterium]|nr:hypothetical protein [Acidobacteriota bacterium]